jgi:hypothetical protein
MDYLEGRFSTTLKNLEEQESRLLEEVRYLDAVYAGLKDISAVLELVEVRFKAALECLATVHTMMDGDERKYLNYKAREKTLSGYSLLDELLNTQLSLEQTNEIFSLPEYESVKGLFEKILLLGGASFFESDSPATGMFRKNTKSRTVSQTIAEAVKKFSGEDDKYQRVFETENLPDFFRELVRLFLPKLAPEYQAKQPYGIEEGEQQIYSAESMKLPLSQAIYFYENEILPQLDNLIESHPGNRKLQDQRGHLLDRIRYYRNLHMRPRSNPIPIEKDLYSNMFCSYSEDGEPMISVPLKVQYSSKSNLDRIQVQIQSEITRQLAGKGISPELDREHKHLKSLESGIRGSRQSPTSKLNTKRGFTQLKSEFPVLRLVADKVELKKLIDLYNSRGKRELIGRLSHEITGTRQPSGPLLP